MGKLFRRKAAFSPFVPLKAAVKVNLPISTLYVAWLCTTVIWPSKSVCVWKLHSKILLTRENQADQHSAGQLLPSWVPGLQWLELFPLKEGEATHTHFIFKHAESKSGLNTQGELYSFRGFCPRFCQNLHRFPSNAMLLGKIRMSDFTGIYAPQKFYTTPTQELTVQL